MDLRSTVVSTWGKELIVNGTKYPVEKDGTMRNVKAEDAKKLLGFPRGQFLELGNAAPAKAPAPAPEPPKEEAAPEPPKEEAPVASASSRGSSKKRRGVGDSGKSGK